jgi:hypothetical protein
MTPLQDMNHPSRVKKTYKTKTAELVPVFAARWRSIRSISTAQMTTNPWKYYKNNCITMKVAPSYNQKMRDQEESEQKLPYFPTQVKKCKHGK